MDDAVITQPVAGEDDYRTLGHKTLWIFVFQRIHAAGVLFVLMAALFIAAAQPALATTPFGDLARYALLGGGLAAALFIIVFGITFLIAWLVYKNYTFALGEDSLKIKRGIMNKEEVAIPYRQIQDVDIARDLSFQMLGLSQIIILTAGHEDSAAEKDGEDESEGILPALDKDLAEWLQTELLKRANVQKVTEEKE